MGQTLSALAIPIIARSTFTGVGRNTTSVLAGLLANGFAASLHLQITRMAAAVSRRCALPILALLADGSTATIRPSAISLEAITFIGCHATSIGTAWIAHRLAVLPANGIQCITLMTATFILLSAHPIATAQGARGDALSLDGPHMFWHTDAGIWRSANAIGAIIIADWFTATIDVGITLIPLATDLNPTHIRGGAIANHILSRSMKQRDSGNFLVADATGHS